MHSGEKSNKCNQCGYASSQAVHLRTHLKIHSGEKSNKCNQCDYASSQASKLKRHMKTHTGEKSHKCNQCDYASSLAGNLRTHLKTHSGEKSHKCNQCYFASSQASYLRINVKTHSKEKLHQYGSHSLQLQLFSNAMWLSCWKREWNILLFLLNCSLEVWYHTCKIGHACLWVTVPWNRCAEWCGEVGREGGGVHRHYLQLYLMPSIKIRAR